jgi:hypothetical protein
LLTSGREFLQPSGSANFRRRNEQLKRVFVGLLAVIVLMIFAGAGATAYFNNQASKRNLSKLLTLWGHNSGTASPAFLAGASLMLEATSVNIQVRR